MVTFRDATDEGTWRDVQAGYHLPPAGIEPQTILDLGCHCGFTIIDFRIHFPNAWIYGVEMDHGNWGTAIANVGNDIRVSIFHCAVATWDGFCSYDSSLASNAYMVQPGEDVVCLTLDTLTSRLPPIDFCKIDIEGTEREIFRAGGVWPERIQRLKAELHGDYSAQQAIADLQSLGYRVWLDGIHPSCVYAER